MLKYKICYKDSVLSLSHLNRVVPRKSETADVNPVKL